MEEKISPLKEDLQRLANEANSHETLKLSELIKDLGPSALPLLLLMTAIPNALPMPGIPGISAIFGLPAVWFGWQMFKNQKPWLPAFLGEKGIKGSFVKNSIEKIFPFLDKFSKFTKPSWPIFVNKTERLAGLACLWCGFLLSLPLIFGNLPPGMALLILSLGLCQKDGKMLLAGFILTIIATIWVAFLCLVGSAAAIMLVNKVF